MYSDTMKSAKAVLTEADKRGKRMNRTSYQGKRRNRLYRCRQPCETHAFGPHTKEKAKATLIDAETRAKHMYFDVIPRKTQKPFQPMQTRV